MSAAVRTAATPAAARASANVDRDDPRMGMRRPHEDGEGLGMLGRVGDEAAGAAHQGVVLDARPTASAIYGGVCIHFKFQGFMEVF